MRLLLDTHELLSWREDSPHLSPCARSEISDAANEILVSIASFWEIVIKRSLGKLRFPNDLEAMMRKEAFGLMHISFQHFRRLEPCRDCIVTRRQDAGLPGTNRRDTSRQPQPGSAALWRSDILVGTATNAVPRRYL